MEAKDFDIKNADIAWCPGCGDFGILNILKRTFAELDVKPENLVLVSGIGQAAKLPHYLKCNVYNGLHGRALPPATAIKAANPSLTVVAISGDGDMYGEGGNHLIHTMRRNPSIVNIVHNNMVYGLTKGQASPTSELGFKTPVQVNGVYDEPINPIALAIAMDASFVARAFMGDADKTKGIIKKALKHKGYSLIDIFQPCVSFNKINTYPWFKEHTYYLEDSYDPTNRTEAFKRSLETDKLPLGVFYVNPRKTFEENIGVYSHTNKPLFERELDKKKLYQLIHSMK